MLMKVLNFLVGLLVVGAVGYAIYLGVPTVGACGNNVGLSFKYVWHAVAGNPQAETIWRAKMAANCYATQGADAYGDRADIAVAGFDPDNRQMVLVGTMAQMTELRDVGRESRALENRGRGVDQLDSDPTAVVFSKAVTPQRPWIATGIKIELPTVIEIERSSWSVQFHRTQDLALNCGPMGCPNAMDEVKELDRPYPQLPVGALIGCLETMGCSEDMDDGFVTVKEPQNDPEVWVFTVDPGQEGGSGRLYYRFNVPRRYDLWGYQKGGFRIRRIRTLPLTTQ